MPALAGIQAAIRAAAGFSIAPDNLDLRLRLIAPRMADLRVRISPYLAFRQI
jgi:hypothetical protein